MKVIEHIESAQNTQFSYEIIPPIRGNTVKDIIDIVEKIKQITGCTYSVTKDAKKHSFPTISIQKIQNEFNFQPTSILTKLNDIITAVQKNRI